MNVVPSEGEVFSFLFLGEPVAAKHYKISSSYKRKPQILIGRNKQAFHFILAAGSRDLALVFFSNVASLLK